MIKFSHEYKKGVYYNSTTWLYAALVEKAFLPAANKLPHEPTRC